MDAIAATILVRVMNKEFSRDQANEALTDAQVLRKLEALAAADERAKARAAVGKIFTSLFPPRDAKGRRSTFAH